jgi:hypothetical protein
MENEHKNSVVFSQAPVVEEPRINVPPTLAAEAILPVTAQSLTPGVTFRCVGCYSIITSHLNTGGEA